MDGVMEVLALVHWEREQAFDHLSRDAVGERDSARVVRYCGKRYPTAHPRVGERSLLVVSV